MNEILKNIAARRSIRAYTEQAVSKQDIETILQAAVYAPSGKNTQNWQFTVVQDKDRLLLLNEKVRKALERDRDYNCYYHAPVLIIVSHEKESSLAPFDCACALENIFLAAASVGLGSCWINQLNPAQGGGDPAVRAIIKEFGIPDNHIVYGCAAVGYAKTIPSAPPRREGTIVWA